VSLPRGFDASLVGLGVRKPVARWAALGLRRADGGRLPAQGIEASLVQPGGPDGPTLLVYPNYRTVLKWNNSNYFASAVGYLADSIDGR
jgi:membrane-bound lytic murein transglycosylase B